MFYKHSPRIQKVTSLFSLFPPTMSFLLLLILPDRSSPQSLFRNPSFTGYSYTGTSQIGEQYALPASNYSLWYSGDGGSIRIKNKTQPLMGLSAELAYIQPYNLCQQVDLVQGQVYEIGFEAGNTNKVLRSTITVTYSNGVTVFDLLVNGSLNVVYGSGRFTYIFGAGAVLCFECSSYIENSIDTPTNGPSITNISLNKVINTITNNTNPNTTTNNITINQTNSTSNGSSNLSANTTNISASNVSTNTTNISYNNVSTNTTNNFSSNASTNTTNNSSSNVSTNTTNNSSSNAPINNSSNNVTTNITNNSSSNVSTNTTNNSSSNISTNNNFSNASNNTTNNSSSNVSINTTNNTNTTMNQTNNSTPILTNTTNTTTNLNNTVDSLTLDNNLSKAAIVVKSIAFKFFRYLTMFIDDIQYYKYHRYEYPVMCQQLMQKFDIVEQLTTKLLSNPSNPFSKLTTLHLLAPKNSLYLCNYSPHPNNPQSIYFLNSIQSTYLIDLPLSILCYVIPKLAFYFLRGLKDKGSKLGMLYRFLGRNFRWWSFIVFAIQNNIAKFVFFSGMQITNLQHYQFSDKINAVLCLMVFLVVLMYCLVFYQLVCKYEKQKPAQTILIHSSYENQGYYIQSYCFLTRLAMRTLIHSTLLQYYQYQIAGLAFMDFLNVLLMLVMRRKFYSTYYFIAYFGYNLLFLVFDLLFCIAKANLKIFLGLNFETMMLFWLWIIVVAYILSILVCTGRNIWQIILGIKKKAQFNRDKSSLSKKYSTHNQGQKSKSKAILKNIIRKLDNEKLKKTETKFRKQKSTQKMMIYTQKPKQVERCPKQQTGRQEPINYIKVSIVRKKMDKGRGDKKQNNFLM